MSTSTSHLRPHTSDLRLQTSNHQTLDLNLQTSDFRSHTSDLSLDKAFKGSDRLDPTPQLNACVSIQISRARAMSDLTPDHC